MKTAGTVAVRRTNAATRTTRRRRRLNRRRAVLNTRTYSTVAVLFAPKEPAVRLAVLALAVVLALAAPDVVQPSEQPRAGGVLRAAMIGEPPTLDLHTTTAVIVQQITWHIYETLFTYDRQYNPVPMLVDTHTVTDNGRTYLFKLRRGVKFHNGKELTSADVVASLRRWGRLATPGKAAWRNVEGVEAKDPYTVAMYLKEPSGSLLQVLDPPNGPAGKRVAYLDEILFVPVPDVAVRLAGVETGEYHYGQQIKPDQYERVKTVRDIVPGIIKPAGWTTAVLNHKQGLMTDKRIRQAFQAALDMEPILAAGWGNKTFYRVYPSLMHVEQPQWYTKVGADAYDQKNPAKAQKLLKDAGYAGQPVRWITTKEYEWMYKNALVARQQLEAAGFKIDLQVVDWATLVQRRNKPEVWDVFSTGITFNPDPAYNTGVQCNWPGWWCHEDKDRWLDAVARESEPGRRRAMWDKVQAIFYEDVGRVKFGDFFTLEVSRKELHGYHPTGEMAFWNVWLSK